MQMLVDVQELESSATSDRRDTHQPSERMIGRLISCSGSRAVLSTAATNLAGTVADFWSIGRLISINLGTSRVIGLVYEMNTTSDQWDDEVPNIIYVKIELVGEIRESATGEIEFRSGISSYPYLGAVAHRIRAADLTAIYKQKDPTAVAIGTLSQDEAIAATVSIDGMLKRHFAVLGTTGVGKSSAVSLLLRKAVESKPALRILILDPHNEYSHAFPDISISIDSTTLELPFWMFRLDEFLDVIFRGRKPGDGEVEILRDTIAAAKARYAAGQGTGFQSALVRKPLDAGNMTADTPVPYRMADLFALIEDAMGKLDPRHNRADLRTLKSRLESLCYDPRFKFMFGRTTVEDNMSQIISQIFRIPQEGRPITVFQLAGLPSEVVNAVASILSRMAFDLAMWSNGAYEILLMCEEAHRYVPQDPSLGFIPTRQAIARIAKEGRKYGCYLGVVTQRPGELDPTILSQCSTVFAMRLANERDQEIIRSAISDSSASTISFLSSIGNREAIAFGEAVATPMRMKFAFLKREALPAMGSFIKGEDGHATGQDISIRTITTRMRGQGNSDAQGQDF
jgi:uncharacterized protein